jgi:hypothetical protein
MTEKLLVMPATANQAWMRSLYENCHFPNLQMMTFCRAGIKNQSHLNLFQYLVNDFTTKTATVQEPGLFCLILIIARYGFPEFFKSYFFSQVPPINRTRIKECTDDIFFNSTLMQFLPYLYRALSFNHPVMNKTFGKTFITLQPFISKLVQQFIDQGTIFASSRQFIFQLLAAVFSSGQEVTGTL